MRTLGRPLRQRGAASIRREPWLEKTRKALRTRSRGRCEGCGRRDLPLDPAHVFGRGNKGIGEPWASCPELMAALCRECHRDIDEGTQDDQVRKREDIRWMAVTRLRLRVAPYWSIAGLRTPLECIRALMRYCDEHGITHPDAPSSAPLEEHPK